MFRRLKYLIKAHQFFVSKSKSYVAPFKFKDYCYYPIAYCKFMRLTLQDLKYV